MDDSQRLLVITGAGCSTASGIPDYRGPNGSYKHGHIPTSHSEFVNREFARRRYWARSLVGWEQFAGIKPNQGHAVLTEWEREGRLQHIITQNVDGLHHASGSLNVIDLHGRNDQVRCLNCEEVTSRQDMQNRLKEENGHWLTEHYTTADSRADGDAELGDANYEDFQVPACQSCGGVLKPDVVFFGDNVPKTRVAAAFDQLEQADAILVVGSSLEVYSAFRFIDRGVVRTEPPKPLAILNLGSTRAERAGVPLLKINLPCDVALSEVHKQLGGTALPTFE